MTEFFDETFLTTLGRWQKGWREDQDLKDKYAGKLKRVCLDLPKNLRLPPPVCYRKRFLHPGEMADIFLRDAKDEGITSWTTDRAWAERFKDLLKEGATCAAIFRHAPHDGEVIINIPDLWKDAAFIRAAEKFRKADPCAAKPLWNFRDTQSEIVLDTPLRGSEVIALVGISSPFDDICDKESIPHEQRDQIFTELVESGNCPEYPEWIGGEEGVARVISNSIKRVEEVIAKAKLKS